MSAPLLPDPGGPWWPTPSGSRPDPVSPRRRPPGSDPFPAVRRNLATEAADMARPRLWVDTLGRWAAPVHGDHRGRTRRSHRPAGRRGRCHWAPRRSTGRGRATVGRAERLVRAGGPAYVKLGQFIATAKGLLPDEWVEAFAWCRDEVPALRPASPRVIEEELGDRRPSSSSRSTDSRSPPRRSRRSTRRLPDGTEVVVKVRRPGLRAQFEADIRAHGAHRRRRPSGSSRRARIANLPGFVELFAQLVLEELDFRLEALNIIELGLATRTPATTTCRVPRPIPASSPTGARDGARPGVRYTDAPRPIRTRRRQLLRLAIKGVLEHTLLYGVSTATCTPATSSSTRTAILARRLRHRRPPRRRAAGALVRFLIGFAARTPSASSSACRTFGAVPPRRRPRRARPPARSRSSNGSPRPSRRELTVDKLAGKASAVSSDPGRPAASGCRRSSSSSSRTCSTCTASPPPSPPRPTCSARSNPCSPTSRSSTRPTWPS